ncbi:MAG: hypothetical protein PVH61_13300 [Candidatus Aminicenantes bacterium]|jgi:hypothetical protein
MKSLRASYNLILFTVVVLIFCHMVTSCKRRVREKPANEKVTQNVETKEQKSEMKTPEKEKKKEPLDIWARFTASGYMGDGQEYGERSIQLHLASQENPHSAPICIRITYVPMTVGWGGVYWQNQADNWGDLPGNNFQKKGYKKLTFWARGENGREVVEFKTGGINAPGKPYRDSFEASTGNVVLDTTWKQYTIDLEEQDLSSVIGGFCWVASRAANPNGLTFYLDDIYYE